MSIKKLVLGLLVVMVIAFSAAGIIFAQTGLSGLTGIASLGSESIDTEKTFPVENLQEIKLETISEDIKIIPVDSGEVKVHYYGSVSKNSNVPELVTDLNNNSLVVKIDHKIKMSVGININASKLNLDIYVPRSFKGDLEAGTVSGDLEAKELALNSLSYRSVSGDLETKQLKTSETSIKTTSGKADLSDFSGNLSFSSVSGDLDARYADFNNDITVSTTSGDTKIGLPEQASFAVSYRSTSGELDCKFPSTIQGSTNRHRFEGTVGNAGNTIEIRSVSGDASIYK